MLLKIVVCVNSQRIGRRVSLMSLGRINMTIGACGPCIEMFVPVGCSIDVSFFGDPF